MARAAAHVFVDDLAAPDLAPADAHHLTRVLRLGAGDLITAGDGRGRWRVCRVAPVAGVPRPGPGPGNPGLVPEGEIVDEPAPHPAITVAFALTKGDRPEWTVQKLTELGTDRIVALAARRSVVRWDEAQAARQAERWRRVAREAACQCRRAWLPAVEGPVPFTWALGWPGAALADPGGGPPSLANPVILVGPEGGWAHEELAAAAAAGLPRVTLGPHVLRAETAALAAAALLAGLRSGTVGPRAGQDPAGQDHAGQDPAGQDHGG